VSGIEARLPGIARAYIAMERCNGGINIHRSKADALSFLERAIAADGLDVAMDLPAIDKYFAGLSDDDLITVVDGEENERNEFMRNAPAGADEFLNAMFDRPDTPTTGGSSDGR
jgi:hypothetical protein